MNTLHQAAPDAFSPEVRERWGETNAYRQYAEKTKDYTPDAWQKPAGYMDAIFAAFADCMEQGIAPDSPDACRLVAALQGHITACYYPCTDAILQGLGQMYTRDDRFRNHIDRHGTGTAEYVCRAICAHCGS